MTNVKCIVQLTVVGFTMMSLAYGPSSEGPKHTLGHLRVHAQASKTTTSKIPKYQPPKLGAPVVRQGGGTRAPQEGLPILSVLAPEHPGRTVLEQPALYWYLSTLTPHPIEVTITDVQSGELLLEKRLPFPSQAGVQRITLADYGIRLGLDRQYQWFVAVVPNSDSRSQDIVAGGMVERMALPEELRTRLAQAEKAEVPFLYAAAGLWYDAIAVLSDLIAAAPQETVLRQQRAALLEQAGLPEVAAYDMQHVK